MNNDRDKPDGTIDATENDKPNELPMPTERVGFCRPPEATRFKKGVSGNPKGRPKHSLNVATAFMKALREKVVINEHGKRKTVTKLEAALKQLVNKAASGEIRALTQLLELARDSEAKQNASVGQDSVLNDLDQEVLEGVLKRFEVGTDESAEVHNDDQPA
jgi:Family of unknown function (DUF5681)